MIPNNDFRVRLELLRGLDKGGREEGSGLQAFSKQYLSSITALPTTQYARNVPAFTTS